MLQYNSHDLALCYEDQAMKDYVDREAGKLNKMWGYGPASQKILTPVAGEQNKIGKRGEWAFGQDLLAQGVLALETPFLDHKGDDYDFILPHVGFLDVKTKGWGEGLKEVTHCQVGVHNMPSNNVSVFVFCLWNSLKRFVTILGWIYVNDFIFEATLHRTGQTSPEGWKVKSDVFLIPIFLLYPMRSLYKKTRGGK